MTATTVVVPTLLLVLPTMALSCVLWFWAWDRYVTPVRSSPGRRLDASQAAHPRPRRRPGRRPHRRVGSRRLARPKGPGMSPTLAVHNKKTGAVEALTFRWENPDG